MRALGVLAGVAQLNGFAEQHTQRPGVCSATVEQVVQPGFSLSVLLLLVEAMCEGPRQIDEQLPQTFAVRTLEVQGHA